MERNPESIAGRMGTIPPPAVREPAFAVLHALQFYRDPAVMLTAAAVAVCAMAEAAGLQMRDAIVIAENTLRDCEGPYTEHVQAIRAYAKGEMLGGGL